VSNNAVQARHSFENFSWATCVGTQEKKRSDTRTLTSSHAPAATPPAEFAAACMTRDANFIDLEGEAWAALDNLPNDLEGEKKEKREVDFVGPVWGGDNGVCCCLLEVADGEKNENKEDVFEGPVCGGDIGACGCVGEEAEYGCM
jgi:hypothetical protein